MNHSHRFSTGDGASAFFNALRYPLRLEAAILIVFGSLTLWLFSASLFGLFIVITVGTGLVQFVLINLRHSAQGGMTPPSITATEFLQFGATPFKLLAVVAAWSGLVFQAYSLLPLLGRTLAITGFGFLPAFATLLVLEDSLRYALHPGRLLRFAWRGGLMYAVLAILLGAVVHNVFVDMRDLVEAGGFTERLIFGRPQFSTLGWIAASLYAAMLFAHVLGRIACSSHDYQPPDGHECAVDAPSTAGSPAALAAELAMLLDRNDRDTTIHAWQSLRDRDHAFQGELLDALAKERAWALVPWQAQRTVSMKLAANRQLDALQITMRTLTHYESFATNNALEWAALCRIAKDAGRGDWLGLLAGKAALKFPGDPALLDIALLYARHLLDGSDDADAAMAVIAPYVSWKSHPRHPQLVRLQTALERI